jgi:hypothetical protein
MSMKKYFSVVMIFLLLSFIMVDSGFVSAESLGNGLNSTLLNQVSNGTQNNVANKFKPVFNKVFGTILTVLKTLGVAGIVFTGVKYMYAGSGDKAAIKQSLIYLVIGTVFLFGADIIIKLIVESWDNVSNMTTK